MINKKSLGIEEISDTKLVIEYVPTGSLIPNEYNPNTHKAESFKQLLRSLALFGFTQPLVVDRESNRIIDGEHRWRGASVLEIKEVPVCFLSLSEERMRLATVLHNQARGTHSNNLMEDLRKELQRSGVDLDKEMLKGRESI